MGPSGNTESLFGYRVSQSVEDVMSRRKSMYYSTTFADMVNGVLNTGKRYAFVGVPCYVTALRHVARRNKEVSKAFPFVLGIVCGHMKSSAYAQSLAWQLGIPPRELEAVDFRVKDRKKSAKHYGFGAQRQGEKEMRVAPPGSLLGANWGHAVFQLEACNYCDDIFAETADIVLGDAWLPRYEADWRGTNLVVVRDERFAKLLEVGRSRGEIELEDLSPEDLVETQAGNFRHRREGLAVRLADDRAQGVRTPAKRVAPSLSGVSPARIKVIRTRRELSRVSHGAFKRAIDAQDLTEYVSAMGPVLKSYARAQQLPLITRVRRRLRREFWSIVKKLGLSKRRL